MRRTAAATVGIALVVASFGCRRGQVVMPPAARPPSAAPPAADRHAVTATAMTDELPTSHRTAGDQRDDVRRDSLMYELRLVEVRRCEASQGGGPLRIGVAVAVTSHVDGLFVAARDFSLERGGVILDSEIDSGGACAGGARLLPKSLRKGGRAEGVIVFRLPDESYAHSARLIYEATRWGGAPRIGIELPERFARAELATRPRRHGETSRVER